MRNIHYITPSDDASSFYRCQGVLPYLSEKGLNLRDISDQNTSSWAQIINCHTLLIQRPYSETHYGIILQAKMAGVKIIIDYDDDLLNVPEHSPAYELYQENKNTLFNCLKAADEVWVTTKGIYDSFVWFNKNIHIIPNAHNDFIFPVGSKNAFNHKNNTVVYRGGHTHILDLHSKKNDLVQVASEYPNWKFQYIGVIDNHQFFKDNELNKNVVLTNKLPIISYLNHLYNLNAPVMINPLEVNPLNIAKSNISWLEGTYAGSAFFGNKNLQEFNKPFIGDMVDFINSTQLCLTEKGETHLAKMNNDSWEYIKENLLLSKVNLLRMERLMA